MAETKFKGQIVHTTGNLPKIHTKAPDFRLVDKDLKEHSLQEFHGKKKLVSTVPSLDTGVCSTMTKHINEFAKKHPNFVFITVSADLPFAQKRFCEQEGVHNVLTLSMLRDKVTIVDNSGQKQIIPCDHGILEVSENHVRVFIGI